VERDGYKECSTSFGKIEYSNMCFQTYPCKHYIKINGNSVGMMGGRQIKQLFLTNNIEVPDHFSEY